MLLESTIVQSKNAFCEQPRQLVGLQESTLGFHISGFVIKKADID